MPTPEKNDTLNRQILLGTLIGVLLGLCLAHLSLGETLRGHILPILKIVGNVFIDLLKMVMIPLVFCSIVTGIGNLSKLNNHRNILIITVGFFAFTMLLAIAQGLITTNWINPGKGLKLEMFNAQMHDFKTESLSLTVFLEKFIDGLFENPFSALAKGQVLPIVIYAIFVGMAIQSQKPKLNSVQEILEKILLIQMLIIGWIMRLSPIGIAALLAQLVAQQDIKLLQTLLTFISSVLGSTLFHGIIVLPTLLILLTGTSPRFFWKNSKEALITALATSSSNATLPVTLRCTTEKLGVQPEIARFVIPLGATLNMDGTALYEAAAAIFIANLCGIELSILQQMVVCFMSMIAAMGAPGIPSAGMVTMVMVLQSVGLPAEAIAILLPIDRILDTFRTMVNVQGDMISSLVIQKYVDADPHYEDR